MKKFLIYIVMLILVAIAFMAAYDVLNRKLLLSSSISDLYKMNRLFANAHREEIAILGSSRAEECFVPSLISKRVFNYGLNGSRFGETVFHLQRFLQRSDNAPVIVNLDPWGMSSGPYRGDYRFSLNVEDVEKEDGVERSFSKEFPGLRFYGELRRNLSGLGGGSKAIDNGAILFKISRTAAQWEYISENFRIEKYVEDQRIKARLGSLLSSNTTHEIVFVVVPVAQHWWDKFEGKEEFARLKEWLSSFQHVRVVDFSNENGYENYEFFDPIHLNEKGAKRFSGELRRFLLEKSLIVDDQ